jgi:hypothetical protein
VPTVTVPMSTLPKYRPSFHHPRFKQQQINNVQSTYKGVQDERG